MTCSKQQKTKQHENRAPQRKVWRPYLVPLLYFVYALKGARQRTQNNAKMISVHRFDVHQIGERGGSATPNNPHLLPNFMLSKQLHLGSAIFDLLVFVGFFKTTEKPNSKLERHDFLNMGAMEISSSENHDYSVVGAGTRRAEQSSNE